MTIYEMAKKYYPLLWDENRLQMLVDAGRLTQEQYNEIIGVTNE